MIEGSQNVVEPTSRGLFPPSTYHPLNVGSGMRAVARHAPDKVALIESGRTRTFAQFVEQADKVAALLQGLGIRFGDTCAILAPNCLEYIEVVVGASSAGIAVATPNPRLTAREIAAICEDCGARVLFVHATLAEMVRDAGMSGIEHVFVFGASYDAALAGAGTPHLPVLQEWDPFSIPYTSGTTGKPKGVVLPHRARVMGYFGMASEYGCYGPADSYLAIAPLCHGAGLCYAMGCIYFGGTCEIMPAFDPAIVVDKLAGVTCTFMVPTHFHAILDLEAAVIDRARRHRLKTIISNAAPLAQKTKESIVELWGEGILHETYGSTEGGIVTNLRPEFQLTKQRCVGKPFPCTQIKLVDDDFNPVAPGQIGELFSISPYLFNGYFGKPEETAASLREGWFSAGDLAIQDEEGFVYIVDRKKDMIISGGVNVYPREIEEVLFRHPHVVDAAVVAGPDAKWGETIVAVIVRRRDAQENPDDLIAYCKAHLASFKVPRQIVYMDALPRNPSGKVLKRELRTALAEG
jgi:acyl-CoA synthetase (AMP-forming)/AMP-acid ligase II